MIKDIVKRMSVTCGERLQHVARVPRSLWGLHVAWQISFSGGFSTQLWKPLKTNETPEIEEFGGP
jgi:hypothetical protein